MSKPNLPLANDSSLSGEVIPQLIQDTYDAARRAESRFRDFATTVYDDEEVESLFVTLAGQAQVQQRRLSNRFEQVSGVAPEPQENSETGLNFPPEPAHSAGVPEERTLQNLIGGYAVASGELAICEVLAAVAEAAGDNMTQGMAREMAVEVRTSADQIWHFLPSRSKIAFNMLTISEVDPSVETKVADNRLLES